MTAYLFKELQSVTLDIADDTQRTILTKAKEQVGFLPNMYTNMVNVPAFLDTYLHGYGLFREQSDLTSAEQEVVFLAISQDNGCNYCTAAHSTLAAKYSGVSKDVLEAIRSGATISDVKLAAIYAMAKEVNSSRGRPDTDIVNSFLQTGYSEKHLLAITLAVSVKVLSNYSNHMFDAELYDTFSDYKV